MEVFEQRKIKGDFSWFMVYIFQLMTSKQQSNSKEVQVTAKSQRDDRL